MTKSIIGENGLNPIKKLFKDGMTYVEMNKRTGLHLQTLYKIADRTPDELLKTMKMETAIKLHEELGVDLNFLFEEYKKKYRDIKELTNN
jgi:hypothetical protein